MGHPRGQHKTPHDAFTGRTRGIFLGRIGDKPAIMNEQMMESGNTAQVPLRALVVDDRDDVAMGLALLLKQMGYNVQVANQAQEALDKGELFRPHMVFLDIGLPDRSGYDACLDMRRSEWGAKAFITAVTGRNEPVDVLRAAHTGFDRHVGKPMDHGTLKEILRSVANRAA
jgi:DNA-binding response OmpR family regulator